MPSPLRVCFAALLVLILSSFPPGLAAQPRDVYPVRPGGSALSVSLNGRWQFKYIAGSEIGADAAFSSPSFVDTAWQSITVPGHWELQGFAEPKYAKVDEGTGLYRRTFRVPANWDGRRIFLHFDGVLYGFDAWVNGTKVGSWASSYNPVAFDVTDALKAGADNVLAVQVTTRSQGWAFDTNDCWALSGIYRDVNLFAVPPVHLTHFMTESAPSGTDGSVALQITAETNGAGKIHGRLVAPDGASTQEFDFLIEKNRGSNSVPIKQPRLWTAETPHLYSLELTLTAQDQPPQIITEKIGLRMVSIKDGVLLLNGKPIKLRGADHHDIWPVNGRVATEELMRKDLELMRAANINFIRTSHYPPHPRFLELCDELGFYVMDEVPFGFGDEHLNDPTYQENLFTRARATVQRDCNRPSVIIWSVGNENPNTPLTFATGQLVKKLDPTRPICFPQIGSYFAKSYQELPDWVDIYAPHYPEVATVARYAKELTRPVIFTEYAHALGLASDRIEAEWAIMQSNPRLAGGAVWMFQDQGILRTSKQPVERTGPTITVWLDATHYYDTSGNGGMDGIVYSDRTPQTDYWEVRKVYSPVQISERELNLKPDTKQINLNVENRYDFRSLSGLKLNWSLMRNGIALHSGEIPLQAPAHQNETIALSIDPPSADMDGDFLWLELHCLDEKGVSFYERSIRLKQTRAVTPLAALQATLPSDQLRIDETPETVKILHQNFTLTLVRKTGEILLRNSAGKELASGFLPHAGRKFTEAERLRAIKSPIWQGALLHAVETPQIEIKRTPDEISLVVHGLYARADVAGQFLAGTHSVRVQANGIIFVDYDFLPEANSTGHFLEAGLAMIVPTNATELHWTGTGPYAGYPGKEALNEFGIYHLTRDDLHFQGNRRSVELAALTQPQGTGLLLISEHSADMAVERNSESTVLNHNAILSGLGNKGVAPETNIPANPTTHIAGHFALLPLSADWPAVVTRWFGPATERVKVFQPFYHSYDQ